MKKILIAAFVVVAAGFASCGNQSANSEKVDSVDTVVAVDSVDTVTVDTIVK